MRARTTPARRRRVTSSSSSSSPSPLVRVHIGDEGGAYISAEWRQEPRRHVTGAPPLRSPCRRGFASRHSAPAALRRVKRRQAAGRGGGSSRPRIARRAYWCTRYILRDDRPASRPVDARRSESRVGVLPIARSFRRPSSSRRLPVVCRSVVSIKQAASVHSGSRALIQKARFCHFTTSEHYESATRSPNSETL